MFTAAEQLASDTGSLSAYFEGSHELLHTIAGVLDIRSVFPRVSEIARKMLPHDALTMSCQDEDLNVHVEAASSDDFRGLMSDLARVPMAPELLIGDLRQPIRCPSTPTGSSGSTRAAIARSCASRYRHAIG